MKLNLKTGEHIRIACDNKHASMMVYIDHGIIHITAQPKHEPTRIIIDDKHARIEHRSYAPD